MAETLSGRTILCVDDYEIALKVRQRVPEMAGYRVLIAATVHRALELFRKNHIDLVMTEHVAPELVQRSRSDEDVKARCADLRRLLRKRTLSRFPLAA